MGIRAVVVVEPDQVAFAQHLRNQWVSTNDQSL